MAIISYESWKIFIYMCIYDFMLPTMHLGAFIKTKDAFPQEKHKCDCSAVAMLVCCQVSARWLLRCYHVVAKVLLRCC